MSQERYKHNPKGSCECYSCKIPEPLPSPDAVIPTRIHYVCPGKDVHGTSCLSDNYRDTRQQTVKCFKCHKIWKPDTYAKNSSHYGQEEVNPNPNRYYKTVCQRHGVKDCSACEKAELYAE